MPISDRLQTLLLKEINEIAGRSDKPDSKLADICQLLKDKVAHYDWVGFYTVNPERERELVLGPYVGEPTDHTRIPFGRGICGQAAETGEAIIASDVSAEPNYLSCGINVKSEIVLPIAHEGVMRGQIDIDSHTISVFDESDQAFLEMVGCLVSEFL